MNADKEDSFEPLPAHILGNQLLLSSSLKMHQPNLSYNTQCLVNWKLGDGVDESEAKFEDLSAVRMFVGDSSENCFITTHTFMNL